MPAVQKSKKSSSSPTTPKTVVINDLTLRITPVFDTFWRFVAERKAIDDRRRKGLPPPWTDDPFLQATRFCNVFRVSDRASQYLIRNVIEKGSQDPTELTFRIMIFNIFTNIKTYEMLETELGPLTWPRYNQKAYARVLHQAKSEGKALYTGSFQKPAPKLGHKEAFMNHLEMLEVLMRNDMAGQLAQCEYMSDAFDWINAVPGMGHFMAYQLLLDLSYSNVINFSQSDFVVAGLGACSGLQKIFSSSVSITGIGSDIIRWMQETQDEHFARLGLAFTGLGPEGLPLQLCDIEHALCEVDKYSRLAHPGVKGMHGRTKIKGSEWNPPAEGCPQELHLPKAWSNSDRQLVRIKPGKPAKVRKRYVVDKIVMHKGVGPERKFLVRWLGYTAKDDTWEPEQSLKEDAPLVVADYVEGLR